MQLNFFSACSKKIRIKHFVLFLAHYATLASDPFTVVTLAEKKGAKTGKLNFSLFLDPPRPLVQGLGFSINIFSEKELKR